jgi:hypothetical protein
MEDIKQCLSYSLLTTKSLKKTPQLVRTHYRLDIQCFEIHNSINTFCTSGYPKDHYCEASLQSDQQTNLTFKATMATVTILKISNPKGTTTHPKDYSCAV